MNFLANLAQNFGSIESQLEANLSFDPKTNLSEKELPKSPKPEIFKLPIQYLDKTELHILPEVVISDLELSILTPPSSSEEEKTDTSLPQKNMYEYLLQPTSEYSRDVLPQWKTHFTTDISFLQQTQEVILTISPELSETVAEDKDATTNLHEIWKDIKENEFFLEKYGYIEWSFLAEWNNSAAFLQCMTLCNILSPLMSFFIPIFILVIPFVLLQLRGIPISISMYLECLTNIAKSHFIGKAITSFQNFSFQSMFYLVGSLGLYLLQMYQNTMQCIRFYHNTQYMNDSLCIIKKYVDTSIYKMNIFYDKYSSLDRYDGFLKEMQLRKTVLENIQGELYAIGPFQCSLYKSTEIGYMMKCFYTLYDKSEYNDAILYAMGFEGYIQQLTKLQDLHKRGFLGLARFDTEIETVNIDLDKKEEEEDKEDADKEEDKEVTPKDIKRFIRQQYYPPHELSKENHKENPKEKEQVSINSDCVKNDANLDQNIIITGPNASGKTTFLKSTAINLILSQQFGMGCYQDCYFKPYTHFHSYLNIPDTSGRDSLFQAESRRCKEILDSLQKTKHAKTRHFCIFDELYSGTNPKEATKSAFAFLKYISEMYDNVDYILTTHYVSICEKLEKYSSIENYRMAVKVHETNFTFTYLIEPGISKIEGAVQILENMEYPEEMLDTIRKSVF